MTTDGTEAPLLDVADLTVAFGGLTAVDRASFQVNQGEVVGIIGPNGAGKTTTFSAIAGTVRPSGGAVRFAGDPVNRLGPSARTRLGIARTFQNVRLFVSMTVEENVLVATSALTRDLAKARRRAAEVIDRLQLRDIADRRAADIPLADQKRTEIARALATGPRLLLLDEMMSGLNPAETTHLVELVRGLARDGVTLLVVEHVLRVIHALSDRVLVFDHGRLIASGPPDVVTRDPAVVEAYVGRRHAPDAPR